MLHASTRRLIHKLCDLTAGGDIAWTEGESGSVRFDTEGYVVEIAPEPPGIRILDAAGREIERADAADLVATPWPGDEGRSYAQHVSAMAADAHRIALGAERAISRILTSLSAAPQADTPASNHDEAIPASHPAPVPAQDVPVAQESSVPPPVTPTEQAALATPFEIEGWSSTTSGGLAEAQSVQASFDSLLMEDQAEPLVDNTSIQPEPLAKPDPASIPAGSTSSVGHANGERAGTFGGTRGFSLSARSTPNSPQPSMPRDSLLKITATGLVLSGIHATTVQTPREHRLPQPGGIDSTPSGDLIDPMEATGDATLDPGGAS
ncbi:MAG: hypothetical protein SGJ21_03580 [Alphaproteobacteria bacterium]|nr:hypothetical protein [Alphaproteobacteria bacterium]